MTRRPPDIAETCDHCKKKPAAFCVKHYQTGIHWRCMACFRDLVADAPVVVIGTRTSKTSALCHEVLYGTCDSASRFAKEAHRGR